MPTPTGVLGTWLTLPEREGEVAGVLTSRERLVCGT